MHADIGASAFKASSPALLQNMTNTAEAHTSEDTASEKSLVTVNDADGKPKPAEENKPPAVVTPFVVEKAYPATIFGLEAAKMHCRFMMNRIITEVRSQDLSSAMYIYPQGFPLTVCRLIQ